MNLQSALALACFCFASVALAVEGTIMRVPGEVSSGIHAQIIVLKVKKSAFEALKGQGDAEIGETKVQSLRPSSSEILEGETEDGKPVVVLKSTK
jgi:hypothetical protein